MRPCHTPTQKPLRPPYLVYFWKAISRSADRGKMTSADIRGRVKSWAAYQGCGTSGRRESHTVRDRDRSQAVEPKVTTWAWRDQK